MFNFDVFHSSRQCFANGNDILIIYGNLSTNAPETRCFKFDFTFVKKTLIKVTDFADGKMFNSELKYDNVTQNSNISIYLTVLTSESSTMSESELLSK